MSQITTLKNGLRIVTNKLNQRDSVSVGLWVGVGGRYESNQIKGAAHFLEHIVFKGCKKYDCEEIKEKIEGVGGALNAFTSEEQTCYYAKIPAKHLKNTFDVLSDMVFFPTIAPKDVKKESTVIVEEIKMYKDLPQYFVYELLDGLMWPNHPLGMSLAGSESTVTAMKARDLKTFHKFHYSPSNIVISAAGNIAHDQFVRLVRAKLGKIAAGENQEYKKADNVQFEPKLKIFQKNIEQMHVCLGMHAYDENHPDRYALSLLNTILGGNMSSRLFVEIREKRGLAYSISSSFKPMHDTGLFVVRAGVDNTKLIDAMRVVLLELAKISRGGISKDEITRGKDYLLGQLQLGLEDTMENMLWIGESVIARNKVKNVKKIIDDFKKIKDVDLIRVAREIFNKNKYCLAVVGPITAEQEEQLKKLLKLKS